jgi:dTDP-4-amino-4,6-dideoxygalactose transaminase
MTSVPFVCLSAQYDRIREEVLSALDRVLSSGHYILGEAVTAFERSFSRYTGTDFVVGVASGTDALVLAMKALGIGPGDEVITAPNSFLASASAIVLAGAKPVFVDVREDLNLDPDRLEAAVTSRTRAIIPVHLTGKPADLDPITALAEQHGLAVIEDAAQAAGARYRERAVGSFGAAGCFSLHPLKVLGACGDGGAVATSDPSLHRVLVQARNHGLSGHNDCRFWSVNSRLDALQAAILSVKLKYFDGWIGARRAIAAFYRENLADRVTVPEEGAHERAVYQTFVIQTDERDALQSMLREYGVETKIHYTVPIHLQAAARSLGYEPGAFPVTEKLAERILSLPIYPELTQEQQEHVVATIRRFFKG